MAPVSDCIYFPSLEECLTGERALISWRLVAAALSDSTGRRQKSPAIIKLLTDAYVQELLKDPSKPFAPPCEQTGKDFETKTAAINVTSVSTERFDIAKLKEDAKWLSQNANINLVAALRLVIIEHQSRPSRHLTGLLSSQDATNLEEAAGLNNGQGKAFVADLVGTKPLDADEIAAEFEKSETKKQNLFSTFLAERRFFMSVAEQFHSIKLYGRLPSVVTIGLDVAELYGQKTGKPSRDVLEPLLPAYLDTVTACMDRIGSGLRSVTTDALLLVDEVELTWLKTLLAEVIHGLSVVLQVVDCFGNDFPPSSAVNQWFSLMDFYTFFDPIQPVHDSMVELMLPLKSLSAAISIAILKPSRSLTYLEREEDSGQAEDAYDSYLLSPDVLEQIHTSMLKAVDSDTACPAVFTWSILLHRLNVSYQARTEKRDNLLQQKAQENFETKGIRPSGARRNSAGSIFSIESTKFDGFLEHATASKDLQVVEQLASVVTTHGKVYDVLSAMAASVGPSIEGSMTALSSSRIRYQFLELLKVSYPIIGYQSEPMSSLMAVLSPGRSYWDLVPRNELTIDQDVVAQMLHDDSAMNFYFQQALDRFPFEFLPFLSLCKVLCSAVGLCDDERLDLVINLLKRTPTLTLALPAGFQGYELIHEDENTNSFCLVEEISLISGSSSWKTRYVEEDTYSLLPGTYGRFITDTGRIATVEYPHSTLALLGRQLEIYLVKEGYHSELGMLQPDEIVEVIGLLATLIRVDHLKTSKNAQGDSLTHADSDILLEASKHIGNGKDITTVVCDIIDYFMEDEVVLSETVAVSILDVGIQFLHSILPLQPSRVWSYLARSELLSSESKAGKLAKITGSLELVGERYEFLVSSLSLFSEAIETATTSAVQRRAGNKLAGRQRPETNPWLGVPDKVLSKVSYSIAQSSVDIFENTSTWIFESDSRRSLLLNTVIPILNKIVLYSYSTGDGPDSENLMSCLRSAASYIVDCFISPASGTLRFQPILSSFITAFKKAEQTLYPLRAQSIQDQLVSALNFSSTLLQVANYLEQSSSMVENYLFKISTLIARLCAVSDQYRIPAISLLEALVVNAGKPSKDPPSLLGYLGPQISKSFLQLLSTLGQPFALLDDVRITWRFFSSILRNRQQWMSNCLLTGQTPREAMKEEKKADVASDSVLATALVKLETLGKLEKLEALAILDFVASAQNYWPWMVFRKLQKDTKYLQGLRAFVRGLKEQEQSPSGKTDDVKASIDARMAAYIAEIFAMQLYHSRHLGNANALAKDLVQDLDFYLRTGVKVGGYNISLHKNLAKNFPNKYYGSFVDNFKRTLLEPRELGKNYYYHLDLANDVLKFDSGWLGRKEDGFKNEMELANANLSLVDAQIALFHAWEFLLLELSTCIGDDKIITRQMLQVAQQSLNANQEVPGPENFFLKLVSARANLALVLTQRLVKGPISVKDINHLLQTIVGSIAAVEEPYEQETVAYYRVLLKTLFVTLRAYQVAGGNDASASDLESSAVTITQTSLNILDHVVARGFRTLVSLIHDRAASVVPEDLALLTAILQASLGLPGIDQSQAQILNIMASYDAVHAAISLFSWADKLSIQGDPQYGELSILFLMELTTLPLVAEHLASDGILSSLLSANLIKFMQKANISPYAESPMALRCYGIWAKGLLPLMLNLLSALGATVAPEVAYVLNQFPHLLQASVDRFEASGRGRTDPATSPRYLTILATSEVHSLALLVRVLSALRASNGREIPSVEWDAAGLLENVDFWLSSKRLLKERLLPIGQRELEWRSTRTGTREGEGCDNVLEAKLVSQLETVRDVLSDHFEG
ncbi:Nucleoporin [Paramyrothecium foliicola]|nr:Nucleoporin [Paramyrothecium foliicola]